MGRRIFFAKLALMPAKSPRSWARQAVTSVGSTLMSIKWPLTSGQIAADVS